MQQKTLSFSGELDVWMAEKEDDRSPALVLRFPQKEGIDPSVYSRAKNIAGQLRNNPSLLPMLDSEIPDEGEFAFYVAYEQLDSFKPLSEFLEEHMEDEREDVLWVMRIHRRSFRAVV